LKTIEKKFDVVAPTPFEYKANPNVSIGQKSLVICSDKPSELQMSIFGFTPSWAKKMTYWFNARVEGDHNKENDPKYRGAKGIVSKPAFRKPIRSSRCLVIADAFIEGPQKERLSKPFVVYPTEPNERPFAFAGVWDDWADPETGEIKRSFAILTTAANALTQKIGHHRAPLLMPEEYWSIWLNEQTELSEVTSLLEISSMEQWNAYPISADIKSPRASDLNLLRPIGNRLRPEYSYEIHESLNLQGMGQTTGRQRRLFED
jgi:putative SOS response-associated peptidase YedK